MIKKVSDETKEGIKRKSAHSLPNRPSEQGMKPEEIKRAFWQPVVDSSFSALAEVDRVIDEVNAFIDQTVDAHISNKENPHNVSKEQLGLDNVDNTADKDKPISDLQQAEFDKLSVEISNEVTERSNEVDRLENKLGTQMYVDGEKVDELDTDDFQLAAFAFEAEDYAAGGSIDQKFKELERRIKALEANL